MYSFKAIFENFRLNIFFKTNIFDYYKNYILVNSRIYDESKIKPKLQLSEKYITFVDTQLEHVTKVEYEGKSNPKIKKLYSV